MRDHCPVCYSKQRVEDWPLDFLVPDGWTLPAKHKVCLCLNCGMIYYDNDGTQAGYDQYYKERYGFDGSLNTFAARDRMDESANMLRRIGTPTTARIVDFGGGEGYFEKRLRLWGYTDVTTCNVGDALHDGIDLLVSTQVFEHLYDLHGTLEKILPHMKDDGQFLIEVPEALGIAFDMRSPLLDYHQKHINHFGPAQLDLLFSLHGYERRISEQTVCDFVGGMPLYRAVYERGLSRSAYSAAQERITASIDAIVDHLRDIHFPVIVWGCGDICLHVLSQVKLDVAYYVDIDPAYRGATIGGVPVQERVTSGEPILVLAQNQKTAILKAIRDAGLSNEVIVG